MKDPLNFVHFAVPALRTPIMVLLKSMDIQHTKFANATIAVIPGMKYTTIPVLSE